jgi:dTDP-4-amino-4,6-dideoxygalactose transaminase
VVRTSRRDALAAFLKERGIGTQVHYPLPPHLQEAYKDLPVDRTQLSESEAIAREALSLPLWPQMSDDMVDQVIEGIKAFFGAA